MNEESRGVIAPDDRVPLGQKVVYGVGMLGNQMFPAALGVFMVVLVEGLGFPPLLWGVLFFVPRFVDAVTDPIMGFITDNTRSAGGGGDHTSSSVPSSPESPTSSCGSSMKRTA